MEEPVWSVSQVNNAVRDLVEGSLAPFWMAGEIGTLTIHRSGHVYLVLKDASSLIRATWFGGARAAESMNLKIGGRVEVFGRLTVYTVRGEYQFNIRELRAAGKGDLIREFEEVKNRLQREGLFAPSRKKPLPAYPKCVGVITAKEGAAIRDFLRISLDCFPKAAIRVYPAAVQGANTVREVCAGLDFFARSGLVDVIVIARGGGSMEDLWSFNSEILARKIVASPVPVVSAVGHEIDFTICDFASDRRAATASEAATILYTPYRELATLLERSRRVLFSAAATAVKRASDRLGRLEDHYVLHEPRHLLEMHFQRLDETERTLTAATVRLLERRSNRLETLSGKFSALDPTNVLKRGYALVKTADGKVATAADMLEPGEDMTVEFAKGKVSAVVGEVFPDFS